MIELMINRIHVHTRTALLTFYPDLKTSLTELLFMGINTCPSCQEALLLLDHMFAPPLMDEYIYIPGLLSHMEVDLFSVGQ